MSPLSGIIRHEAYTSQCGRPDHSLEDATSQEATGRPSWVYGAKNRRGSGRHSDRAVTAGLGLGHAQDACRLPGRRCAFVCKQHRGIKRCNAEESEPAWAS